MTDTDDMVPDWSAQELSRHQASGMLRLDMPVGGVVAHSRGSLCYLATPYSKRAKSPSGHFCIFNAESAAADALLWATDLAAEGVTAISPILQSHAMADQGRRDLDPLDHNMWMAWCAPLLLRSDVVIVPPIRGWQDSVGVWQEVLTALSMQKPVMCIRDEIPAQSGKNGASAP